jgi:ABC-type transport system involved in cytochrome c biogenesis ATPase subunit/GNAT superfamily N-acetyltransferase
MDFDITVETRLPDSYRVARTHSLFNVTEEQAASHRIKVSLPLDERPWRIGAIIGPSGTGKTTLGRRILGPAAFHEGYEWPADRPIVDVIGPDIGYDDVTSALAAVGLGTVPSWLRPYHVLSMGEKFRAELARLLVEHQGDVVIDEFTSVVDRQIAQVGANAFAKAWRRKEESDRAVVLSCHYDIVDWLQPDWLLDTREWRFDWRSVQRRPDIPLTVHETNWSAWPHFEPHHYLKLPQMVAATNYVAEGPHGEPVAHVAVSTMAGMKTARLCRLVVMPEWQGAGVGMKFLEYVAERWLRGENRYGKRMTGIIHTSHPGLIAALRRSPKWVLVSQQMGGGDKAKSAKSIAKSQIRATGKSKAATGGYGGHVRAVSGFRYVGSREQSLVGAPPETYVPRAAGLPAPAAGKAATGAPAKARLPAGATHAAGRRKAGVA